VVIVHVLGVGVFLLGRRLDHRTASGRHLQPDYGCIAWAESSCHGMGFILCGISQVGLGYQGQWSWTFLLLCFHFRRARWVSCCAGCQRAGPWLACPWRQHRTPLCVSKFLTGWKKGSPFSVFPLLSFSVIIRMAYSMYHSSLPVVWMKEEGSLLLLLLHVLASPAHSVGSFFK
jgi:hypothetical protein